MTKHEMKAIQLQKAVREYVYSLEDIGIKTIDTKVLVDYVIECTYKDLHSMKAVGMRK